ncbi:MAG: phage head-tail connector protein [bacterium]
MDLCTLAELKAFLGIAAHDTADDGRLSALITAASAQIEGYCDRSFGIEDIADELHDGDGTDTLELDKTPILFVSALSIDGLDVDPGEVRVYPKFIAFPSGCEYDARLRSTTRIFPEGRQNVKVSYRAGYSEVPREIADACKIQVAFLMNTINKQGVISETNQMAQATTSYAQEQLAPATRATCRRYRRTRVRVI